MKETAHIIDSTTVARITPVKSAKPYLFMTLIQQETADEGAVFPARSVAIRLDQKALREFAALLIAESNNMEQP